MNFKMIGFSILLIAVLSTGLYYAVKELGKLKAENTQLANTLKAVSTSIETQNSRLSDLDNSVSKIRKETSRLDKVLSKLDLNKMGKEDPKDLEVRINKGTDRILKELGEI